MSQTDRELLNEARRRCFLTDGGADGEKQEFIQRVDEHLDRPPTDPETLLERADQEVSDAYRDLDQHADPTERAILGLRSTLIDCTEALVVALRRGSGW